MLRTARKDRRRRRRRWGTALGTVLEAYSEFAPTWPITPAFSAGIRFKTCQATPTMHIRTATACIELEHFDKSNVRLKDTGGQVKPLNLRKEMFLTVTQLFESSDSPSKKYCKPAKIRCHGRS